MGGRIIPVLVAGCLGAPFLQGCGYPPPQEVRPGVYQLDYCDEESKCFEAAEKTCPNGYRITKYNNIRPEEFVCES